MRRRRRRAFRELKARPQAWLKRSEVQLFFSGSPEKSTAESLAAWPLSRSQGLAETVETSSDAARISHL